MRKILIIGGTSSVAETCIPIFKDYSIVTAGRKNCDLYIDFEHLSSFNFPDDIEVVIIASGYFHESNINDLTMSLRVNSLAPLEIAILSILKGVKQLIYISSIFSDMPNSSPYFRGYCLFKHQAEESLNYLAKKYNLPLTILKPSQLIGKHPNCRINQPFFYKVIENVFDEQEIILYGKHDAKKNYLLIDDLAIIILKVIEKKVLGIFTCTSEINITIREIAELAAKIAGKIPRIKKDLSKEDLGDNTYNYDDKLYKIIDYYPKYSIFEHVDYLYNSGSLIK
jgi:nucleoside-diphosphate-sugar epimerase